GSDPVALGLVTSLNRPGGNVTGVTIFGVELTAKRLDLLRELTPHATRFVALVNPRSVMADGIVKNVEASAPIFGLPVEILHASTDRETRGGVVGTFPKGRLSIVGYRRWVLLQPARLDRHAGGAALVAHRLLLARICRGRRADQLR